ncbi:MAG: MFS transporter [Anaerolineae bacterium]|nr:MFS transporter [Anaerolineae bacterium]
MNPTYPKQKRNLFAFGLDTIAFSVALGFINVNTILPTFVSQLGASSTSVGLLVTIFGLSWSLPQLFAGNIVARFERKKPLILVIAFAGRITIPAMAVLITATGANPPWLIQAMLYIALAIFLGSDAVAAVCWLDMLGRAFPPDKRGRYISIWQSIAAVGVMGASELVRQTLSEGGLPFPNNFALIFALGGAALYISAIGTTMIYEPPPTDEEASATPIVWRDFGRHLIQIVNEDHRLRQVIIARVLFSYGMMAFPFYVLYATEELHIPEQTIGVFIFAQTVGTIFASLILGRIADRRGPQHSVQIGAVIVLSAPILALITSLSSVETIILLRNAYLWIYICIGLATNLLFLGFTNYVLDIAPASQRTIYLGAFSTINSLGVIAPTLAGWLLATTSYSVLFAVSLAFGVLAAFYALRLPSMRQCAG